MIKSLERERRDGLTKLHLFFRFKSLIVVFCLVLLVLNLVYSIFNNNRLKNVLFVEQLLYDNIRIGNDDYALRLFRGLQENKLLGYSLTIDEVRVGDLYINNHILCPVGGKYKNCIKTKITENNLFLMFLNNSYNDYCRTTQEKLYCSARHIKNYRKLANSLESNGYDYHKGLIIINSKNNVIRDGQHRASWVLWKYGSDAKIKVLKLR